MKLTSIQVYENTRKELEDKKLHQRESYDSVLRRILEHESFPSMEDMFREGDKLKQKQRHTTKKIIGISHELRRKR
ncbi:hypothetical protein HYU10_02025 [Candidatus Woesearchaeota archaeon]|nr:hypothetical protein [Candidatus Woesearchaeota archaeon]MBI2130524.1 hypothetical protein [Candidatus Woesearchaeota archaeon]MBI2661711.1 hypothetical protein [Candidatus Woesearchaeota archaeon]